MLTKALTSVVCLAGTAFATARTSPPAGALVVGEGEQYTSIQDAVDAVEASADGEYTIFIQPGTYEGQVLVPAMDGIKLTIYGYTTDDQDYSKNEVLLTNNLGADDTTNNDASGTLRTKADYLKVYNLNIANTRGQGDQAIALSAYGDYEGFYGCQLLGYQDTLLSNIGNQFYSKTYIEGRTDFIFGQYAVSWFDKCDIGIIGGTGWITANGRSTEDGVSFYVFDQATVTDEGGVGNGAVYLGRPWREYSRVVFQNSNLGAVVNSAGWSIWNEGDERTGHVYYAEYENYGAGAEGDRADFSFELDEAMVLGDLFSTTEWIDLEYSECSTTNGRGKGKGHH